MSWFKKKSKISKQSQMSMPEEIADTHAHRSPIRYRATFPIDVWVEDKGDIEVGREEAYGILTKSLDDGLGKNAVNGSNYDLYLSDLKTDSEVFGL
jgi:hypothetical protein